MAPNTQHYEQHEGGLFTRERILTTLLAIITLFLVYLCFLLALPFLPALTFALAIAVATQRPYRALRRHFSLKTVAAAVGVVLVALLVVLPAVSLIAYGLQQGSDTINSLNGNEAESLRQSVENNSTTGNVYRWVQKNFNLDEQIRSVAGTVASRATAILKGSFSVLMQAAITLFVLFFIYRDGDKAIDVLTKLLPLSSSEAKTLFKRINDTILATVNGSFIVALVQSFLASVMYFSLNVPAALLWGLATFFMALLPVFGTFAIWGPVALYLFLIGSSTKALILIAYGIIAIGMVDNILYPYLVGDKMRLHTVPTFFAVLGGITLFGASGLILGPAILAITFALLDVWWRRTLEGKAAEAEVSETSQSPSENPAGLLGESS